MRCKQQDRGQRTKRIQDGQTAHRTTTLPQTLLTSCRDTSHRVWILQPENPWTNYHENLQKSAPHTGELVQSTYGVV